MLLRMAKKPAPDLISEVVGDARRVENWSDARLRVACVGPLRFIEPFFSRYYFLLQPQVVVDFEPAPVQGKFYCDHKRAWCHTQGIVYVPIFLRERLTRQQITDRVALERQALVDYQATQTDVVMVARSKKKRSTKNPRPGGYTISDPDVQALVDEEAAIRLSVEEQAGYKLHGFARSGRLGKIRRDVEQEFLTRVRDGSVGHQLRYRESTLAARR